MADEPTTTQRLNTWLLSGETGASSLAIARWLTGEVRGGHVDYPADADDFARCEGLLDAVPEFRGRLGEMAVANAYWAALAPRWEEIRAVPDDRRRYTLLRSILDPVEHADPNAIRLNGATIRFGRR